MTSKSTAMCAAGLVASLMLGTALSAEAAPLFVPPTAASPSANIITVEGADASQAQSGDQTRVDRRGRVLAPPSDRRDSSNYVRPSFDRSRPSFDRGFERRGSYVYYNGHRGYRDRRDGYRYHDGFWFPAAAFVVGAIIGGAMVAPAPVPASNPHVDWCLSRYRSYNPYDNTFQPYGGPRAYCRSPYG